MTEVEAPPIVDDGRDIITNSRLSTFRDCAMKHALMYEDGIRPVQTEEALRLGSLFHVGLEAWWSTVKTQDAGIKSAEDAETYELGDALHDAWRAAIAAVREFPDTDQVVQVKVEEMLRAYHTKYRYDAMQFEVLQVEVRFEARLVNPDTMHASKTFLLGGKIDVIAKLRKDGSVGVIEHKTSSENIGADSDYWAKLAMDPQISFYVIGAESLGLEPAWTLYDVAKKPDLRPLEATPRDKWEFKQRRTAEEKTWAEDDPRLLYARCRATGESLEEYRARVRALLEEEGSLERFFARRIISRTQSQMYDFLADTWVHARSIAEFRAKGRRPRNPSACHRFGTCAYWKHCAYGEPLTEETDGGKWRRLSYVHPELLEVRS